MLKYILLKLFKIEIVYVNVYDGMTGRFHFRTRENAEYVGSLHKDYKKTIMKVVRI